MQNHTRLGWVLNLMTGVLLRPSRDTQGKNHVMTEAETGMICLQAKECQGLPEPQELREKHGTDSSSELPERTKPAKELILDIWPSEL